MNNKHLPIFLVFPLFSAFSVSAKMPTADTAGMRKAAPPLQRFYIGGIMDGAIFSTASGTSPDNTKISTVRFTYGFNIGATFNWNLGRHFGVYTGLDLKNIGFIEKESDVTTKRRTYNLGVPVGIKIGNMSPKRMYVFFGGGADAPINYKEKTFTVRNEKTKYNEWFSKATPAIMPYVFAGIGLPHGMTLKAQYYPNNYLNPDYVYKGAKVNTGYDVQLMLFSLGFYINYSKHHDMVKKHVTDMNTM